MYNIRLELRKKIVLLNNHTKISSTFTFHVKIVFLWERRFLSIADFECCIKQKHYLYQNYHEPVNKNFCFQIFS